MIILLVLIVILGLIFWGICEFISAFAGVLFILAAMCFLAKMTKQICK